MYGLDFELQNGKKYRIIGTKLDNKQYNRKVTHLIKNLETGKRKSMTEDELIEFKRSKH